MRSIVIAATSSNAGKTTISTGIMAAFVEMGLDVRPFKVGPDYIDPKFHKFVTKRNSYNLDSFLVNIEDVKQTFYKKSNGGDISIIEGVMGMYDGMGTKRDTGSTAHMSKIINSKVILVIDGRGMSASAAAQVLGYKLYDPEVKIAGVIINRLKSKMHYELLKESIERDTDIKCVGWVREDSSFKLESKHLGLIPVEELNDLKSKIEYIRDSIKETVDLNEILKISESEFKLKADSRPKMNFSNLKIGIAKDSAFSFYYQENIDMLLEAGVELIEFSPLKDKKLPLVDGLYIGGGFPERFKEELSKNIELKTEIKKALENGLPCYAECGGLMYLTKEIDGFEMVGFFDAKASMTDKLQRFGYVEVETEKGISFKAHEFHHSKVEENSEVKHMYNVKKIRDGVVKKKWTCGLTKNKTLAAYAHVHFGGAKEFLKELLKVAKEKRGI